MEHSELRQFEIYCPATRHVPLSDPHALRFRQKLLLPSSGCKLNMDETFFSVLCWYLPTKLYHVTSYQRHFFRHCVNICVFLARQPPVGQGLLIHEVCRSRAQRSTTVGRTTLDEWSTRRRELWQNTTLTTDKHPCPPPGFEPANISRRAAADLRLRPCGHWNLHRVRMTSITVIHKH